MKVTVEMFMNYTRRVYPFLMEDEVFKLFSELCETRALKLLNREVEMLTKDWPEFEKKAEEMARLRSSPMFIVDSSKLTPITDSGPGEIKKLPHSSDVKDMIAKLQGGKK